MRRHSAFYKSYIKSDKWKAKKARLIVERGGLCERCKLPPIPWVDPLQLHHLNYDRLGNERDSDLQLVHKSCHKEADKERKRTKHKTIKQERRVRHRARKIAEHPSRPRRYKQTRKTRKRK